jgi:hypothetical protein
MERDGMFFQQVIHGLTRLLASRDRLSLIFGMLNWHARLD